MTPQEGIERIAAVVDRTDEEGGAWAADAAEFRAIIAAVDRDERDRLLTFVRGTVQDYLHGRPMEDCFGEICEALS